MVTIRHQTLKKSRKMVHFGLSSGAIEPKVVRSFLERAVSCYLAPMLSASTCFRVALMATAGLLTMSLSSCNSSPADAQATASAKVGAKIIPEDPPMDQALAADPLLGRDYIRSYDAGVRIPPRFRGIWATDPASCSGSGEALLVVGPTELRLPEGTRIANRVEVIAFDAVAVGFTRAGAPPKGTQEPARLHISADKNRLFLLDGNVEPIGAGWVRCPESDD